MIDFSVKYRFKDIAQITGFIAKSGSNPKIYEMLKDKEFKLDVCSTKEFLAIDDNGKRITENCLFDFTADEIIEYLEVVTGCSTISMLHDWAIKHALTDISVEKVIEMHRIYKR